MLRVKVEQRDNVVVVTGQTYTIRESLKQNGAKWAPDTKSWNFDDMSLRDVEDFVDELVYEVRCYINEAKELWNEMMDNNNIHNQKNVLRDAGVYIMYKSNDNTTNWHLVVGYADPKLAKYADEIVQYFTKNNIKVEHRRGM